MVLRIAKELIRLLPHIKPKINMHKLPKKPANSIEFLSVTAIIPIIKNAADFFNVFKKSCLKLSLKSKSMYFIFANILSPLYFLL